MHYLKYLYIYLQYNCITYDIYESFMICIFNRISELCFHQIVSILIVHSLN